MNDSEIEEFFFLRRSGKLTHLVSLDEFSFYLVIVNILICNTQEFNPLLS